MQVIVYAALYLKFRRKNEFLEDNQEIYAAKIADILHSEKSGKIGRDSCIQFLLKSNRDLRDLRLYETSICEDKFGLP